MKGFAFISTLLFVASIARADIIYLKNGRQIECESAWEEGKEIKYQISGGIVGMPRSMVAKVVHTDPPAQTKPASNPQTNSAAEIPEPLKQQTGAAVTPGAIQELEKQVNTDPAAKLRLAKLYTSSGIKALNNKDTSAALEDFQKAYSYTKNGSTCGNLALIYFMIKDDFNADFYFNEALRMNPKDTISLNYLGEIAWRNENLADAETYWQKSLAIKQDPEIRQKLESLKKEKSASDTYENATSRHFLIKYDGGNADPNLVREINDYLEEVYQQLSSQFETYPNAPFIVVLYPQKEYFNITDAPVWSAGANDGKIKLPVKGMTSLRDDLKDVLMHELTHSFVDYKSAENCPAWLQEGLAQYMEGKRVGQEGAQLLATLIVQNRLSTFSNLTSSFAGANASTARILYLQSLAFVEFLTTRYPFYQMNQLLDELAKGARFQDSFESGYLNSLAQMEASWRSEFVEENAAE